jgi:hypothetical protein
MARRAVWCVVSAWKRESAREAHAKNQQDGNPRKLLALPAGPQPGHGATLRTSHVSRERANGQPTERIGVRESKLASERANWRPREQIGVRESGWALG